MALDQLALRRLEVELFVRWLQEIRRFKPSTVSRRLSVVICFYRTCVIDAILDHSPAAYVRRPAVPAEYPCPGWDTSGAATPRPSGAGRRTTAHHVPDVRMHEVARTRTRTSSSPTTGRSTSHSRKRSGDP
jgi:hypothetical protein